MTTKTCTICQTIKPLTGFSPKLKGKYGKNSQCIKCLNARNRARNHSRGTKPKKKYTVETKKVKQKEINSRISAKFNRAVYAADKRNLEFTITKQEYAPLTEANCHYCNDPVISLGVGLDRVDSSKGYTLDNVVPSCGMCNVMKSDHTVDSFFIKITQIYIKHIHGKAEYHV